MNNKLLYLIKNFLIAEVIAFGSSVLLLIFNMPEQEYQTIIRVFIYQYFIVCVINLSAWFFFKSSVNSKVKTQTKDGNKNEQN